VVSQREAGKYLPDIEKLQSLLNQKKVLKFYEELDNIYDKLKEIRKEEKRVDDELPKEEKVLLEWTWYYRVIAPLISFDELDGHHFSWERPEIGRKLSLCEAFCEENVAERAKQLSVDENRLLRNRIEAITALFVFFRKVEKYAQDVQAHEKEDAGLKKQLSEEKENSFYQEDSSMEMPDKVRTLNIKLRKRGYWRSELRTKIPQTIEDCEEHYVRKLVKCFPNQERIVHDYIKKSGIFPRSDVPAVKRYIPMPAEVEINDLLKRSVGRNKENEWVYRGLPNEKKLHELTEAAVKRFREERKREEEKYRKIWEKEVARQKRNREELDALLRANEKYLEDQKKKNLTPEK
jgi:hypothetical protein